MSYEFNAPPPPPQGYPPMAGPPMLPPQSGSMLKWILIIGGVGLLSVAVCCGGGYLLVGFGMNIVEADLERQLRDHPRIREALGEIESFETNWAASMAIEDDDTFVYDVVGTIARGEITVDSTSTDDSEEINWAELRLTSGETIELEFE